MNDSDARPGEADTAREGSHNVISLLQRRAAQHPRRPALLSPVRGEAGVGHRSITFAELSTATEAVAAGLAARDLGPGDRVFLFVPMVAELYVTLFGVLRLGAVAIFLDSWARADQLAQCAQQVEPRGFVGPEPAHALIGAVPGFENVRVALRVGPGEAGTVSLDELLAEAGTHPVAPVAPGDSALVTFTTGSSGIPKGADRTHGFLVAQHTALDRELSYAPDDVDLPVFPVFSLNNLAAGVTTVLPDIDLAAPDPGDGARLLQQLRSVGATCSTLSPSLLRGVVAAAAEADARPPLRRVVTGGAPVGPRDVVAFGNAFPDAELHILYGSTEVEPIAHLVADEMPREGGAGVCLGRPSSALDLRFIRPTREAVALDDSGWAGWSVGPAEGGELLVSGDHVCQGYFRNPDAFARAKILGEDGRVWHRTGDVCRMDANGRLWMLGRVHNAILRDGELLFPVAAELLMSGLPFVERSAYIGVPDAHLGEAVWAVFTARAGSDPEEAAESVRSALSEADIPVDRVVPTDEIPMDPRHHSKVDADALRSLLLAGGAAEPR